MFQNRFMFTYTNPHCRFWSYSFNNISVSKPRQIIVNNVNQQHTTLLNAHFISVIEKSGNAHNVILKIRKINKKAILTLFFFSSCAWWNSFFFIQENLASFEFDKVTEIYTENLCWKMIYRGGFSWFRSRDNQNHKIILMNNQSDR